MSAAATSQSGRVGVRTELARYTVPAGDRIVYGQRVAGVVRVTDCPARGRGRAFLVERELEQDGRAALEALIIDYLDQAQIHYEIPMLRSLIDASANHDHEPT